MYRQRIGTLGTSLFLGIGLLIIMFGAIRSAYAFAGEYALKFNDESFVRLGVPGVDTEDQIFGTTTWSTTKSLSVWMKPTGISPASGNVGLLEHVVGNNPRWFGISRGIFTPFGQDRIWIWNTRDGTTTNDIIGIEYEVDKWIHIVMVHDNDILYAYKNGVLVDTIATTPTNVPNPGATSRYMAFGGSRVDRLNFQGEIDEVAIWPIALTQDDVREWVYRELTDDHPQWANLSAYYKMSNGSGTSVSDNSSNSHTGNVVMKDNQATPQLHWIASGAFAGPRNALAFDGVGSDDHVTLGVNANTVLGGGWADAKTAELWARPTGSAPGVGSAAAGDILFAGPNWGISQADLGAGERLYVWNNDGSEAALPIAYSGGEWVHITLVHAGGTLSAYRNGILAGSMASGSTGADGDLFVGGLGSGQYFQGELDELRLWSGGRTAAQIQSSMFQTLAGNESNLAAYYRFDQYNAADQTILYDITANNLHGTLQNINPTTAWTASTAFNTWIGSDSAGWLDGRNWSRTTAPTAADNVSIPNYPNSLGSVLTGTAAVDNLSIAAGATLTLTTDGELTIGDWLHVAGTLDNNGRIQQTLPVNGSDDVHFLDNSGTYGGVTINANDEDLGSTLVSIRSNQECTSVPGETVLRCIDISPTTTSNRDATITFYFLQEEMGVSDCDSVDAYHWNGANWEVLSRDPIYGVDGRDCSMEPYSIRVTGVTDFSPFVLAVDDAPTSVALLTISSAAAALPLGLVALLLLLSLFSGLALTWRSRSR